MTILIPLFFLPKIVGGVIFYRRMKAQKDNVRKAAIEIGETIGLGGYGRPDANGDPDRGGGPA